MPRGELPATLEEVERAEVLRHVQDAGSPMREERKTQVERALAHLGVSIKPVIQVLNKIDLVPPPELVHLFGDREAVSASSLQYTGFERLLIASKPRSGSMRNASTVTSSFSVPAG